MLKVVLLLSILMLVSAERELAEGNNKELNENMLMSEIEKLDEKLNKQIIYELMHRQQSGRNKRSDIDSRLMELQAKIDLVKAFQSMPAGHGKFDFDRIGKRSVDGLLSKLKN